MALRVTRRSLLAGAGVAVVAAGGAVAIVGDSWSELVGSILHRLVGPFNMDKRDFDRLVSAVDEKAGLPRGVNLHLVSALERTGLSPEVIARAPPTVREHREMIERTALTELVIRTNYLHTADPSRDPLVYLGTQPCSSPYANFSMT